MIDYNISKAEELAGCLDPEGMTWAHNDFFSFIDSLLLYSFIKHFEPQKIIEVGCGNSTRIIRQIFEGHLTCIDPEPRIEIEELADEMYRHPVQYLTPSMFGELGENDILFIDSSHEVQMGGDGPFLFLDVIPNLKPGVIVQVHDIFLPSEYPATWMHRAYGEQYLLAALLENNPDFEVLFPACYVRKIRPDILDAAVGEHTDAGSFWMVKR